MERHKVEAIFNKKKEDIITVFNVKPSIKPVAVLLGGQSAAGKSSLTKSAKKDYPDKRFLVINGDNFREFHPDHQKIIETDIENYSTKTQLFSNVFTEGLIQEAIKNKYDVIIEGTMRNPATPLKTAGELKKAGFRVEAYVIAAPSVFTEIALFNRYQEEVEKKGAGRLADLNAHNEAVKGLPKSLDTLYNSKAVDKISIYTFQGREKVKDITCIDGNWDVSLKPSFYVEKAIEEQLKDKPFLLDVEQRGLRTLEKLNPELKEPLQNSLKRLQNHIINLDLSTSLKEAALKNDFNSILLLKEQGVKLTPAGLKDLEVSGVPSPTLIAIRKIFDLPANTPGLGNIDPVKSPTIGKDKNNTLSI